MANIFKAIKAFWATLAGKQLPALPETATTEPAAETDDQFTAGAVFTLALLQREGRLIDFLMEDLSDFNDAQIGAAVRQIHNGSSAALKKYFQPQPVVDQQEGQEADAPEGFDPSRIRVTGNCSGNGPFKGTLRHKGWAASPQLPQKTGKTDPSVICPAEINC